MTNDDLKRLAAISGLCLTIIEPLPGNPPPSPKGASRLVTAIQRAEFLLTEAGFSPSECEDMLHPLLKAATSTDWSGRKGSVVMFRAPDFTMVKFWPDTLAPRVHFGQEFLVLPLLQGLIAKRDFWLLGLGIKTVHLYRGSGKGLVEVMLPKGLPRGLSEYEAFDIPDHTLRGRSSAGTSMGSLRGVQFGTSSAREALPDYIHNFFRAIDRGIHPILAADHLPLILAGVTRELAIYRKVNTYAPILAGSVHGSPDSLGVQLLYEKAAALMAAYSNRASAATLMEMEEASNRGLVVSDPSAVLEAARLGQVDELIVSTGGPAPGQREETINWAALATVRNDGRIAFRTSAELQSGVAAILRFHASPGQ